jgi:hypothetical protein
MVEEASGQNNLCLDAREGQKVIELLNMNEGGGGGGGGQQLKQPSHF